MTSVEERRVNMLDFRIRKMKKRDIQAVQSVANTSWHTTYEEIIPFHTRERFLLHAYSKKMLKRRLRKTNIFVAEADNRIVGFANYSPIMDERKVHLHAIYLYFEYQGTGIGTALLEAGMNELGAEEVVLNVERQNLPALKFYHAKGFEKISEFDDDFDGHTIHTIRMSLKI